MKALAFVFALCAPLSAQEVYAWLRIAPVGERFYAQQKITVKLSFGIRKTFEHNVVQPFSRRLDVAARVTAPFFEGAVANGPDHELATFALNNKIQWGRRIDDPDFTVLEIEKTIVPQEPGELTLTGKLVLSAATTFRDDILNGRVPLDKRDATYPKGPFVYEIQPLPEQNRPASFGGAVGNFTVQATSDKQRVEEGESFKLTLRIAGVGNLRTFPAPKLAIHGFHVRGRVETKTDALRTIVYDLASREGGDKIPALPFSFFDPKTGKYQTVQTTPIPIEVTRAAQRPEPGEIRGLKPIYGGMPRLFPFVALLGPWLLAAALFFWRRSRPAPPEPPQPSPVDPVTAFDALVDLNPAAALAGYLASRLGCSPPAVVSADLEQRLLEAGLSKELAHAAAHRMDALHATRFGKQESRDSDVQARKLVQQMEATR